MATLEHIVERGQELRKSLGKRMKSLRKKAAQSARGLSKLNLDQTRAQLGEFRRQLGEVIDLEATRAKNDACQRVDISVDGDILLEEISIPVLLVLRREVKYHQKLYRQLGEACDDTAIDETARRLEALRDGIEEAFVEANHQSVEPVEISAAIDKYLFADATDLD